MTQRQINTQMQRLMKAEAEGRITPKEFEAHLEALRKEIGA
jgi:hypothetical protein